MINKKASKRKYILGIIIIFLLIILSLFFSLLQTESKPDPASEAIIRQAAAEQLYQMSLPKNTVLKWLAQKTDIEKKDPNDLTDEDFARIKEIQLTQQIVFGSSGKSVINIIPLEISDIKLLEKFTNLEQLDLGYVTYPRNKIPIWMKLMAKIGAFDIQSRCVIDLHPLEKLGHLQKLKIYGVPVNNIEPLARLDKLKSLTLNNTIVSNFEPLKEMTNLEVINLNNSRVSDLEPFRNLKNLRTLLIDNTQLFSPGYNKITNLEIIKELPKLQELTINGVDNMDIELVSELRNLQKLSLRHTQVKDLEPITSLTNLRKLVLDMTLVENLEPISNLKNLQELSLYGLQVSDISPLRNLKDLRELTIPKTQVSSLDILREFEYLQYLDIRDTNISDLEPLKSLVILQTLHMSGCVNITDEQIEELKNTLPILKINK